jgi:hypothetical protein
MAPLNEVSHDDDVGIRHWPRQIANASAVDPHLARLSVRRQRVRVFYHRSALVSSPALPSAPDNKSFTSVSSPILDYNAFTSIFCFACSLRLPAQKTLAAPSGNCPSQAVIRFW